MNQERVIPPLRYEIMAIDASIFGTRRIIKQEDVRLRSKYRVPEESLYGDSTYNANVYQSMGHAAGALEGATSQLVDAENARTTRLQQANPIHAALLKRVPDMSWHRKEKPPYREVPIDSDNPLHDEPVVPLSDYNVPSQSYYSRPNSATGDAVPGVKPEVFVRASLAEKFQWVNEQLKRPEITDFFGGEVELYVEEGWRDPRLQKYLFDEVIPQRVRLELAETHSHLAYEEMEELIREESKKKIAWSPKTEFQSPAPHESGGAGDVTLRYVATKERVYFGRGPAQMVNRTDPDNFEHNPAKSEKDQLAAQNLMALYAIMRGTAFHTSTGLEPNPTEFWHWSVGDQLNYIVSGIPPYYGYAPMNGVSTYEPEN